MQPNSRRSRTATARAAIREVHAAAEKFLGDSVDAGFRQRVQQSLLTILARYGNDGHVAVRVTLGTSCGEATIGFYDRRGDEIFTASHLANALHLPL